MAYEPKTTAGGNGYLGGNGTFPQIIDGLQWVAQNRDQKDLEQEAALERYADQAEADAVAAAATDATAKVNAVKTSMVVADPDVAGAYLIGE